MVFHVGVFVNRSDDFLKEEYERNPEKHAPNVITFHSIQCRICFYFIQRYYHEWGSVIRSPYAPEESYKRKMPDLRKDG